MRFIIEAKRINSYKIPAFDFCNAIIEAIEYNKWAYNKEDEFLLCDDIITSLKNDELDNKDIPIGSVEFVNAFLLHFYHFQMKPLNLPIELYEFAGRNIIRCKGSEIADKLVENNSYFIKDDDIIKGINFYFLASDSIYKNLVPDKNYFISDRLNGIVSEYRCFVYNNTLIDCKNYSGNFMILPDFYTINKMINKFDHSAYTLDVAVLDGGITVPIECHDFISCGLYGFKDYNKIYNMTLSAWKNTLSWSNL